MNIVPQVDPEFKALIPPLTGDERAQLEENILSRRRCRDAIILWDGTIIDGHNRFEICMEHGIEFQIEEMTFESRDEAMVWILENQLGRRNLNEATRIEIALQRADLLKEKAKKRMARGWGANKISQPQDGVAALNIAALNDGLQMAGDKGNTLNALNALPGEKGNALNALPDEKGEDIELAQADSDIVGEKAAGTKSSTRDEKAAGTKSSTQDEKAAGTKSSIQDEKAAGTKSSTYDDDRNRVKNEIATIAGVGEGTVQRYMEVMMHASPALINLLKSGQIKIGTAHKRLPKEVEKRLTIADKQLRTIAKYMPMPTNPEANETMCTRINELRHQLTDLITKVLERRRELNVNRQSQEQVTKHPAND